MELLRSINEELKENQQLEEAGMLKKAAGKVLSAVGAKKTGAQMQGAGEAAQKTKQLEVEFYKWAGQQGKKPADVTLKELGIFLSSKQLPHPKMLKAVRNPNTPVGANLGKVLTASMQENPVRQAGQQARAGGQQAQQPQAQQANPAAGQPQQGGSGKLGNIAKALAGLDPSARNSLIAALQG